jgi:archaellum component FlaC
MKKLDEKEYSYPEEFNYPYEDDLDLLEEIIKDINDIVKWTKYIDALERLENYIELLRKKYRTLDEEYNSLWEEYNNT